MNEREQVLAKEHDDQLYTHARANLLVRLEKLLEYDRDDLDTVAFERNFRECQLLYKKLKSANE